jgi:hypothetical protein
MTCQNLQNKLLNITVLFIWYLLQILGEFKKNVTRQRWRALFPFGEYLFQSTRHFGECLKKMVSHTAWYKCRKLITFDTFVWKQVGLEYPKSNQTFILYQ